MKDNESNSHPLRNPAVKRNSYLWEFSAAKCTWFYAYGTNGLINATAQQLDTNSDGIVSCLEVKEWQMANGDALNGYRPYSEVDPPEIRCGFHRSSVYEDTPKSILNVTVGGNIRLTRGQWESQP